MAGDVVISIRGAGCGIPESALHKIFASFYTTNPGGVGTGLGLALIDRIIKEHHSQIRVDDSTPGKDATFTLKIPVNLKAEERKKQP